MKAQQLCSTIVRQYPSPLLSFLAPSAHISTRSQSIRPVRQSQYRSISSTQCLLAPEQSSPAPQPPREASIPSHLGLNSRLISKLNASESTPSKAENNRAKQSAQSKPQAPASTSNASPDTDTRQYMDPALRETPTPAWGAPMNLRRPRQQLSEKQQQINTLLKETTRPPTNRSSADFLRDRTPMLNPTARKQEALTFQADRLRPLMIDRQLFGHEHARTEPPLPVRLDAYMGRAQVVDREKLPLARAITQLRLTLTRNQVYKEMRKQKFHERPGLRRKRLKSERWRTRFKGGFINMLAKVKKMKAQGW